MIYTRLFSYSRLVGDFSERGANSSAIGGEETAECWVGRRWCLLSLSVLPFQWAVTTDLRCKPQLLPVSKTNLSGIEAIENNDNHIYKSCQNYRDPN
jgi:hypothetical protein